MVCFGLVLSAGGARGAYEAGVLHYVRSGLPPKIRNRGFSVKTGTSVGAINTMAMAALAGDSRAQADKLKEVWLTLGQDQIYRRDFTALTHFLNTTVRGLMGNLVTLDLFKFGRRKGPHFQSFLDTTPLAEFLKKTIRWEKITKNIKNGRLDAVAINATNLSDGQAEIFLQKKSHIKYTGRHRVAEVTLGLEHAMASSAIPILFPPIHIGKDYFADGGLRLFTPLSPALHLGADRLLVVGLRHQAKENEKNNGAYPRPEPTVAHQMGRILNGVFLDHIQNDLEQMERINQIIACGKKEFGEDFLQRLHGRFLQEKNKGLFREDDGIKEIQAVEIAPSTFVSKLFMEWFDHPKKNGFQFSAFEKLMIRLLDVDPVTGQDLLSYITFAPGYLHKLFELGYQDGRSHRHQLIGLLEPTD